MRGSLPNRALQEAKWVEYCHLTPGAGDQMTSSSLTKALKR
jgi:hypothetical protein